MSMVINHNIPALQTYNIVNASTQSMFKTVRRLSSGFRINSASDDAAGSAISEQMRSQITGITQALQNAENGVSMLQVAEIALTNTHSLLQRMRELSVQAANDTITVQDRSYLQREIEQLRDEITSIGTNTQFNTKKLLDGSADALWTSDKATTVALIGGSIRSTDAVGNVISAERNYKITIKANPGTSQTLKTDIFKFVEREKLPEDDDEQSGPPSYNPIKNTTAAGITPDSVQLVDGSGKPTDSVALMDTYSQTIKKEGDHVQLKASAAPATEADRIQPIDQSQVNGGGNLSFLPLTAGGASNLPGNVSLKLKVITPNNTSRNVEIEATALISTEDGSTVQSVATLGTVVFRFENDTRSFNNFLGSGVNLTINAKSLSSFQQDDTYIYQITKSPSTNAAYMELSGSINDTNILTPNSDPENAPIYSIDTNAAAGKTYTANYWKWNGTDYEPASIQFKVEAGGLTGTLNEGDIIAEIHWKDKEPEPEGPEMIYGAPITTKLYNVDRFWTTEDVFMINDPQTITITQGDGKFASFTIYRNDTLGDLADKIDKAIREDLGQGQYVSPNERFATYVESAIKGSTGAESVPGTIVIRSAVAGSGGELTFSCGSEPVLCALSLNQMRASTETEYNVTVTDAHDESIVIARDKKITGNRLVQVIHPNVDVQFDAMSGVTMKYDSDKHFMVDNTETVTTYLHLKDNATTFQIGANEQEIITVSLGDARATALGLDQVFVTDREHAARSITIIDEAIDKVSSRIIDIGKTSDRMENSIANLMTSYENLTSAISRIKDTDMAEDMMKFMRFQINVQAGTAMLTQANQLTQNVMSLIQ